jgi:hypothetical protein
MKVIASQVLTMDLVPKLRSYEPKLLVVSECMRPY